jgi:hypothetical protein
MPSLVSQARKVWSGDRLARLGFLVGLGWSSKTIAADPVIASTPANVRAQARRLGLTLRAGQGPKLPFAVRSRLEIAAARRGLTPEALLHLLLLNAGSDDALIDNILDDRD